jgi:glycosyltransferase involved in cell wall biosynthesis
MRILWHSNAPWAATGYGVQTRLFAPRIRDLGHDVSISAFYGLEGASIQWQGMTVYPKAFHPYGMDVVSSHARNCKADVVLTLIDGWVMDPKKITESGAKWSPLFPVDHDTVPQVVLDRVQHGWRPITYSKHGHEAAKQQGCITAYVPHGVDLDAYTPMDKDEARKRLGFEKDSFIIGIVAANKGLPSRKALPTQLEAFARFRERHRDAVLYLHTHLGSDMEGLDLAAVMQAVGVSDDSVKVCDQYRNIMGYSDNVMAALYSSMDVLSSVTMGEGFGVPIIEAQACGTPVVVGGWTAMPELVGAGWTVTESEPMLTPMNAYQHLPTVDGVLAAYEAAYEARRDEATHDTAVEFASLYGADRVTREYWRPVLESMADDLDEKPPAELPPVEVA